MEIANLTPEFNSFQRVFSFSRIETKSGKLKVTEASWKAVCTIILFVSTDIISIYLRVNSTYTKMDIVSRIIDSFTSTYFAFQIIHTIVLANYKQDVHTTLSYYNTYTKIDRVLNINKPALYAIEKQELRKYHYVYILITVFLIFFLDKVLWMSYVGWLVATYYTFYTLNQSIMFSVFYQCAFKIKIFNTRLRALAKCYERMTSSSWKNVQRSGNMWVGRPTFEEKLQIKDLGECYLLLNDQCELINEMHGVQILLLLITALFNATKYIYFLNVYLHLHNLHHMVTILPICALIMRLLHDVSVTFWFLKQSHDTKKARQTILLAGDKYKVENCFDMYRRVSMEDSMVEFAELVARRPLAFTANDFYTLGYSFFSGLIGTIVTYAIVLNQMKNDESHGTAGRV